MCMRARYASNNISISFSFRLAMLFICSFPVLFCFVSFYLYLFCAFLLFSQKLLIRYLFFLRFLLVKHFPSTIMQCIESSYLFIVSFFLLSYFGYWITHTQCINFNCIKRLLLLSMCACDSTHKIIQTYIQHTRC